MAGQAAAVLLSIAVLCPGARAQTVDLRERYQADQVLTVRGLLQTELHVVAPAEVAQALAGAITDVQRSEVRYQVVAAQDGYPTRQRALVVTAETTHTEPGKEPTREESPLVGQLVSIHAARAEQKTFTTPEGQPLEGSDPETWCNDLPTDVLADLQVDVSAVQPGDEWDIPLSTLRRIFSLSPEGEGSLHARFAEVRVADGRQIAVVALQVQLRDPAGPDQTLSVEATGEYRFDVALGLPHSMELAGTATVEGSVTLPSGEVAPMRMEGPIRVALTLEPSPAGQ